MAVIRVTDRATFKMCRRKWKYQVQWEIVPKEEPKGALWVGTGVHYGLAEYYRSGQDPWTAAKVWVDQKLAGAHPELMWAEERTEINDLLNLMAEMLIGYPSWAQEHDDFKVLAVEQQVKIRIPHTRSYLAGAMDLIVQKNSNVWDVDHKTAKNFISPEVLEMDDQMTAYMWLLFKEYGKYGGAMYNELRKKIPAEPQLLANGKSLSKNKNIDTTYEKYLSAVQFYGFKLEDYAEFMEFLKHNEFYRRSLVVRSKFELDHFGEQLTHEAREMNSKHTALYPHQTRDCGWACSYRDLCNAESTGGDVKGLMDYNYEYAKGGRREL